MVDSRAAAAAVRQLQQEGFKTGTGPTEIDSNGLAIRLSDEYVKVGDQLAPSWLEARSRGDAATPGFFGRVEIRNGVPRVVDFGFHAEPGEGEVRQTHLRSSQVESILVLVAAFSLQFRLDENGGIEVDSGHSDEQGATPEALGNITRTRTNRRVTPEFLREIAEVYRENIASAPTKAVQDRYFVSPRMASDYVHRARQAGFLPPTTKGKKQA